MFIEEFGSVCGKIVKAQKRKTVYVKDMIEAMNSVEKYEFLKSTFLIS